VVAALAREVGRRSAAWAGRETISGTMRRGEQPVQGTRRTGPVRLQVGFASDDLGYAMDLGVPKPDMPTVFELDPEIKVEHVWSGPAPRPAALLTQRHGAVGATRSGAGCWRLSRARRP